MITSDYLKDKNTILGNMAIAMMLEYCIVMLWCHSIFFLSGREGDLQTCFQGNFYAFSLLALFTGRAAGILLFIKLPAFMKKGAAIVLYTAIIALASIIMLMLPMNEEAKGVMLLSIGLTILRFVVGAASIGNGIGGRVYAAENIKEKNRDSVVGVLDISARVGNLLALMLTSFIFYFAVSWKTIFWISCFLSLLLLVLRLRLKLIDTEIDAKRRMERLIKNIGYNPSKILRNSSIWRSAVSYKTLLAMFFVELPTVSHFFFIYVFFSYYMRVRLGLSCQEIVMKNFFASCMEVSGAVISIYLGRATNFMKVVKWKLVLFTLSIWPALFFLKTSAVTADNIIFIQGFYAALLLSSSPVSSLFYKHFPVFVRFRYTSIIYAMTIIFSSLSICYIIFFVKSYIEAIAVLLLITAGGLCWGMKYFIDLTKKGKEYPDVKRWGL